MKIIRVLLMNTTLCFLIVFKCQFSNAQIGAQQLITSPDIVIDGPIGIIAADFDNDGDNDIISAANVTKIILFENLGNSIFQEGVVITNSVSSIVSIHAADIDNDGDDDLFSASAGDNKVAWYENLGNGTFGPQYIISTSCLQPWKVYTADIDNDNDLDVISASNGDDKIAWFTNLGAGTFGPPQVITSNLTYAKAVYAADLDGDNFVDIIGAGDYKACWYQNLGGGTFGPEQVLSTSINGGFSIIASDFDNDLDIDICYVSKFDDKTIWHENLGGASFGPQQVIDSTINDPIDLFVSDFNGDGFKDILVAMYSNKVVLYENSGTGSFGSAKIISDYSFEARSVYGSDLNDDGLLDVLSVSLLDDKISFYINLGACNFDHQQNLTGYSKDPALIATADFDNDGFQDIYTASNGDSDITWYKNLANSNFSHQKVIDGNNYGNVTAIAADVDNNGLMDIVGVQSDTDIIKWYKNQGGGVFDNGSIISSSTSSPQEVVFADMNLDGISDFIYTDDTGSIFWKANLGNGNFGPENIIGIAGTKLFITDLDNDGDNDIICGGFNVSWIQNLGGGNFSSPQMLNSGGGPTSDILSYDLDQNGLNDVIWAYSNNLCVFYNLGGSFSGVNFIDMLINFETTSLFCGDIDNDSDIDILASNNYDNILLWKNLGNSSFSSVIILTTEVDNPSGVCLTDLNNDGDLDILSSSIGDDKLAWYENFMLNPIQLTGYVFYDINQSNTLDSNDIGIGQVAILSNPLSEFTFVDTNGFFFLNFSDTIGTAYEIYPSNFLYWDLVTDSSSYTIIIDSSYFQVDSLIFGFYPNVNIDSLDGDLVGGFPLCNAVNNLWIQIDNFGTTIPSGIISLQLDDSLVFLNADIPPDSVVGQIIYWNYDSLMVFDNFNINVQVLMPDFNSINDSVTCIITYTVDSIGTAIFVGSDTLTQIVTCAYDPNDKTVLPDGVGIEGYIPPSTSYLDYTIRFQNTGNDTAQVVVITDQLDDDLIWSTLNILSSSHDYSAYVDLNGMITFTFNNIQLPDSSSNEPASHGFIKYRINVQPNLSIPTEIKNFAQIFFDQNPAVITNSTLNTIFDCELVLQENLADLSVCQFDSLSIIIPDTLTNTLYQWNYFSNISLGTSFSWFADSAGVFDLELAISNSSCSADTIIQVNALSPIESFLGVFEICQNDSLLLFNNYQTQSGTYYDTLLSIDGCDSVLAKSLIVHTPPTIIAISVTNEMNGSDGAIDVFLSSLNPYSVSWSNGATTEDLFGLEGGVYIITLTDSSSGCQLIDSITVDSQLGLMEKAGDKVRLIPNPNDGKFELLTENLLFDRITLIDQPGRVVTQFDCISESKYSFDLGYLERGMYRLIIQTICGTTIIQNVIIQ